MSVAMICSNCRHWFPPRGYVAVGKCRRFPATVSTHGHDMCGEWQQVGPDLRTRADVATGPTRTMVASGPIDPGDMVKEVAPGVAEAADRIQGVKKGGKR
jgi:hypothetical protein